VRQHLASTDVPTSKGQAALDTADRYAGNAHTHATKRAYRSDWAHFADWCQAHAFIAMPAEPRTVGAYLASLGDTHAPNTIRRRLSPIGKAHPHNSLGCTAGGFPSPRPMPRACGTRTSCATHGPAACAPCAATCVVPA
jgi:hypothetical protein